MEIVGHDEENVGVVLSIGEFAHLASALGVTSHVVRVANAKDQFPGMVETMRAQHCGDLWAILRDFVRNVSKS